MSVTVDVVQGFEEFVEAVEPRLRLSLMASFGQERGREATAEALAYAWENWDRIRSMEFPVAYLHRVGRSRTRGRKLRLFADVHHIDPYLAEPGLLPALESLSRNQRMAVVLVHAFDWTIGEAARVMGVRETTVKTHLRRGLAKLRRSLGGDD